MKNTCFNSLGALLLVVMLASCQKYFLEKPETTGNTTIETAFANRAGAEAAVANAYRQVLVQNLWNGSSINNGILTGISGEVSFGETWASLQRFVSAGFAANPPFEGNRAQSTDNFFDNFRSLRQCFIVIENIDKAADIPAAEKEIVKAEMKGLIAYRYTGMFIRYGGVPLLTKSLASDDDLKIPRASLQATLDFIVTMADEAAAGLPDNWETKYNGRLTKGVALATKARALLYAARPLFNAAAPVLAGENNELVCFGNTNNERWTAAIQAHEAALAWAKQNGYDIINTGGGLNTPNTKAFDDYGTATSVPANKEVLLAYKLDEGGSKFYKFYNPTRYSGNERYLTDNYGMLTGFLENYYRADGTNQQWPGQGASNALPYADYAAKMQAMEPRFKASNYAHGIDTWNNPGEFAWTYSQCSSGQNHEGRGKGAAQSTKYYYKAGSRIWFEFPLFRVPEFYLSLAEAYNEAGNTAKALENLNMVHNRAGLPPITETSKDALRKTIQREWAVEFYNENKRYFDVRHWKLAGLENGILGGSMREFQFTLVTAGANDRLPQNLLNYYDKVTYATYWHPKMFFDPIPQEEIDKGVLVQNPGY